MQAMIKALALAAILALGAAGSQARLAHGQPTGPTLVIAVSAPVTSIDPHYHNLTPNLALARHIFSGLTDTDEHAKVIPALAESWRLVDDRTWEFKPQPDARFHDGTPFVAEGVAFTLDRVPKVPNSPSPYSICTKSVVAVEVAGEALRVHGLIEGDYDAYLDAQLRRAGLDPAYERRYPHQFSGGQRQRVGITRALAVQPKFLVCDEAVAALDVSIQAPILNLFTGLRRGLDLTFLFISHDLGVVEHFSDRVAIMYLGRIVEQADAEEVFARANHPYTQALLAEVPRLDARARRFTAIVGEIPSPPDPPAGCHFHPRCPHAFARCRAEVPALREVAPGHRSACHLNDR